MLMNTYNETKHIRSILEYFKGLFMNIENSRPINFSAIN